MEQLDTHIAIKIQSRKHYDQLTEWLAGVGLGFTNGLQAVTATKVWDGVTRQKRKVRALIVNTQDWRIQFADNNDLNQELKDWNYLNTTDFKQAVRSAVNLRELDGAPRMYRLLKDSVECRAGTIVQEVSADGHYKVTTMELRTFPEDSDRYFREFGGICFSRKTVEDQPEWFERVFLLDEYLTESQYVEIKTNIQNGKK